NFATTGCKLVLWDIDEKANAETKQLCEDLGCEEIYTAAARVNIEIGDVDIVINNAGLLRDPGDFLCKSDDFIEKTIQVNMLANMWMAKAFLPRMIERDSGHIVAVCSTSSIFGAKDLVDYSASKFGAFGFQARNTFLSLRTFSVNNSEYALNVLKQSMEEALENEMYSRRKRNIHFTTICPTFMRTRMIADIPVCPTATLSPEVVAEEIFDAILTNERILLLPRKAHILYALKGLLPRRTFQRLLHYLVEY
ncbi:hypothetical protein GCK32_015064, partial [Trichostrongylus colubriformis]